MKICLAQTDIIWENKSENRKRCLKFIEKAKAEKADLIIFPEMSLTGFSMHTKIIGEDNSETVDFFKSAAMSNKINVCFGYVKKENSDFYNRCAVADKNGIIIGEYDKIHPFSFANENKYFKSGNNIIDFKINSHIFSCFICYDLRFPEVFRIASQKSDAIIVTANWPKERIDHWDCLLKARAIENQCFIIGVNRTGGEYNGHSSVYSPYGKIINKITENETPVFCSIDFSQVIKYRAEFPLKSDIRYDLYTKLKER